MYPTPGHSMGKKSVKEATGASDIVLCGATVIEERGIEPNPTEQVAISGSHAIRGLVRC